MFKKGFGHRFVLSIYLSQPSCHLYVHLIGSSIRGVYFFIFALKQVTNQVYIYHLRITKLTCLGDWFVGIEHRGRGMVVHGLEPLNHFACRHKIYNPTYDAKQITNDIVI